MEVFHVKHPNFTYADFISHVNVSRETFERLALYSELLTKWQQKINLVSPDSISNQLNRHFVDSAQLFSLISGKEKSIFDLGSGAGFPGLVLSIMGAPSVRLIESDKKKSTFLSEVIRQTGADARVISERIERLSDDMRADLVTSRACAPLGKLLGYAHPLLAEGGRCLFLQGQGAQAEVEEAASDWMFHVEQHPSITDPNGCVLAITQPTRR